MDESPVDVILQLKKQYCLTKRTPSKQEEGDTTVSDLKAKPKLGDIWVDTENNTTWVCYGVLGGSAVWQKLGTTS
jgi:hypothetical protein